MLLASNLAAFSTSSSVVHLPSVSRSAPSALSLDMPIGEEQDSHLGDVIEDKNAPAPLEAATYEILKQQVRELLNKNK